MNGSGFGGVGSKAGDVAGFVLSLELVIYVEGGRVLVDDDGPVRTGFRVNVNLGLEGWANFSSTSLVRA